MANGLYCNTDEAKVAHATHPHGNPQREENSTDDTTNAPLVAVQV